MTTEFVALKQGSCKLPSLHKLSHGKDLVPSKTLRKIWPWYCSLCQDTILVFCGANCRNYWGLIFTTKNHRVNLNYSLPFPTSHFISTAFKALKLEYLKQIFAPFPIEANFWHPKLSASAPQCQYLTMIPQATLKVLRPNLSVIVPSDSQDLSNQLYTALDYYYYTFLN